MAGRRPMKHQAPDPSDRKAWAEFVHWLRHYPKRGKGAELEVRTLRGWERVQATDWILRLPGRELYLIPEERRLAREERKTKV